MNARIVLLGLISAVYSCALQAQATPLIRVFTTAAVPLRRAPFDTSAISRVLPSATAIQVNGEPEFVGAFVRVTALPDSGWVPLSTLRIDPSQIAIDSATLFRPSTSGAGGGRGGGGGGGGISPPTQGGFPAFVRPLALAVATKFAATPVSPIVQRFVDNNWMLRGAMKYEIRPGAVVFVPTGFVVDFASVPAVFRGLVSSNAIYSAASVMHDYLYWTQGCSQSEADRIFKLVMLATPGINATSAWAFYVAVRLGGWQGWAINARDRSNGMPRIVPAPYDSVPAGVTWPEYRDQLVNGGVSDAKHAPIPAAVCAAAR